MEYFVSYRGPRLHNVISICIERVVYCIDNNIHSSNRTNSDALILNPNEIHGGDFGGFLTQKK